MKIHHSSVPLLLALSVLPAAGQEGGHRYKIGFDNVSSWLRPTAQLDSAVNLLRGYKAAHGTALPRVTVVGSSSPDGNPVRNIQIANRRARYVADYIREQAGYPDSLVTTDSKPNCWQCLADEVQSMPSFPGCDRILAIARGGGSDAVRTRAMRRLDGGRAWHRLMADVFPHLRAAVITIEQPVQVARDDALREHTMATIETTADTMATREIQVEEYVEPQIGAESLDYEAVPTTVPDNTAVTWVTRRGPVPPQPRKNVKVKAAPADIKDTRLLSAKTNALFLAALTTNAGVEYEPVSGWSIDLPIYYSPYNISPTRKLRLLAIQPEVRWWPQGTAGEGFYVGLHTHIVGFNVEVNDHGRYQDPGHALWGWGVGGGWATHIDKAKRWGLELSIGGGWAEYRYNAYNYWKDGKLRGSSSAHYWGLTRLGVSLSYQWHLGKDNAKAKKGGDR